MRSRLLPLASASLVLAIVAVAPSAQAGSDTRGSRVRGTAGGFDVEVVQQQDSVSVRPAAGGGGPSAYVEERLIPTCSGNLSGVQDVLCQPASSGCPDPAQLRVWVFRRTVTPGVPPPSFRQVLDPPFRCVGAQEPALDPRLAVAALVEQEFQRVVVLRGVAQTSPSPRTLVNVVTRLQTPTVERYDIPLQLLGQSVVITAQAQRWEWHTGDGAVLSTDRKGTQGRVEHVYRTAGTRAPYVVITWTGTYSVNGVPQGAVPGSVTTQGEPGSVEVRQARTQLVDD